jgi:hypothetical protein
LFLVLRNQNDRQGHAWKNTSELGKTESGKHPALLLNAKQAGPKANQ